MDAMNCERCRHPLILHPNHSQWTYGKSAEDVNVIFMTCEQRPWRNKGFSLGITKVNKGGSHNADVWCFTKSVMFSPRAHISFNHLAIVKPEGNTAFCRSFLQSRIFVRKSRILALFRKRTTFTENPDSFLHPDVIMCAAK